MKISMLLATLFFSFSVLATDGVFCRDYHGKTQDVMKAEWSACQAQIYSGEICFKGSRKLAITVLNSDHVREIFDGTDGEYIKGAHFTGPNAISYYAVDEANQWSQEHKIFECK